jgi:protoporphyrinogen oxidase
VTLVAVIGAGPAGLAAALSAAEAGNEVVLVEAGPVVGGMAGSFDVQGLRVDYGSHRLHASTAPQFLERLRSLLGDDLQARERNGRIRLRDRWVAFPLRLGDMARRLPPGFGARVGFEAVSGPLRRGRESGFVADLNRRLGPTVTTEFYHPYAEKLYGVDPATLTGELARRRVSASSPLAVLRKAFDARHMDGRTFYYPRRGYGQVSEALADAGVAAGVDLRLGQPVDRVTSGSSPSIGVGSETIEADVVLSTMPLPALASALQPPVGPDHATALAALRMRAMVLVYLVVDRPRYTPFDAHYFPSTEITMARLSEPKNYRDGDDPDSITVLCAEIACWPDDTDPVWAAGDDELAGLVIDDLARSGLPDPGPVAVETRRLGAVYPVYEHRTQSQRAVVDRWLDQIPGVLTFGRQGLGVPDNLHHVLEMGLAAGALTAGPMLGSSEQRASWSAHLARFAKNVVVD